MLFKRARVLDWGDWSCASDSCCVLSKEMLFNNNNVREESSFSHLVAVVGYSSSRVEGTHISKNIVRGASWLERSEEEQVDEESC